MKYNVNIVYPNEFFTTFYQDGPDLPSKMLEVIFDQWNHGERECENFIDSKIRSLSVGDIVGLNGYYYQCANSGWIVVSKQYVASLNKYDDTFDYDGGWSGDGSGTDDLSDFNANEAMDYQNE